MRVPVPEQIEPADRLARVHFVGVGGAALSGLARIMAGRGVLVSGSDAVDSPALASLRALGVTCWVGHDARHGADADPVVISTAVRADNPEVTAAYDRGARVWPRAAAVQSVLLGRRAVVVTGTHGKTTTASMLATALLGCGADPSYAVGSALAATGVNAADGRGELFVVEGDESDGAILAYTPYAAVVTNVDADHLDQFGTREAYAELFDAFLARVDVAGFVVCWIDDPGAARLATAARRRGLEVVGVGTAAEADARVVELAFAAGRSSFGLTLGGHPVGRVELGVPGPAYAADAATALATGLRLGFPFKGLAAALGGYRGSARRMELKGTAGGVRVYDSYAHHPVEIAGDLAAARDLVGAGRLVVGFQPHLFSRTRIFGSAMGVALGAADAVVVTDVYPAREDPEPGVTGKLVADAVPLPADAVTFEPVGARLAAALAARARPGDLVLTLGAGDITEIAPAVLDLLEHRTEGAGR